MENLSVEGLKKIHLELQAGESPQDLDLPIDAPGVEFIFGIGPEGMTPFEYELFGKRPGDAVLKEIGRAESRLFFQHIPIPVSEIFSGNDRLWIKATIRSVTEPTPREIVRAMAEISDGGCGGDCGCGCQPG